MLGVIYSCLMKLRILSWNVRWVNDSNKMMILKSFIKIQKVGLVCLKETKIQEMSMGVVRSLGTRRFLEWGVVNDRGVVGGILVFWDNRVLEPVGMELGLYSISCRFKSCDDGFVEIFTRVYDPTLGSVIEDFWDELGAIRGLWSDLWCIGGNFNVVRLLGERFGAFKLSSTMRKFTKVSDDLQSRDLPLLGGSFTWSGGLNNQAHSRLDCFLVSEGWEGHFSCVLQCILPRPVLDHCTILLDVGEMWRGSSPFRFENM